MMNLLITPETTGYPTDYLLARIKGRRAYLFSDLDELILNPMPLEYLQKTGYRDFLSEYSKEGVWYRVWAEYRWLYWQMNTRLRRDFYHLFVYFELKRITRCLRYKVQKGKNGKVSRLLSFSLISKEIRALLTDETDLSTIIEGLEGAGLRGLSHAFSERGLVGLESALVDCFFDEISIPRPHHLMRSIFSYIIDSINITILYKYLRWSVETPPVFIDNGTINQDMLLGIFNSKQPDAITRLIHRLTGIYVKTITPSNIETVMKKGLMKKTGAMRREGSDRGIILDYIWRRYIEAENLGIILYGEGIDSDALNKELVI